MSVVEPKSRPYQIIDGMPLSKIFNADVVRSAIRYKPRDDDVFLVTYPKCGTTWAQQILLLIFRQGDPVETHSKSLAMFPFLEVTGAKGTEAMARPGNIRVHLPFHLTPWNEKAKYIYVARNPKDTCVSYFHHMKNINSCPFTGTFSEFFEVFLKGEIDYGDYFDHLLDWYEHRNDDNVLFMSYEEMKENPESSILKMASFLDDTLYAEPLRQDPEKLRNILKFSNFDYMKEHVDEFVKNREKMTKEDVMKSDLPEEMKKTFLNVELDKINPDKPKMNTFVRKGLIGDWRNYFSEDQSRRMDEKFIQRTKGTDIPNFWKEYM